MSENYSLRRLSLSNCWQCIFSVKGQDIQCGLEGCLWTSEFENVNVYYANTEAITKETQYFNSDLITLFPSCLFFDIILARSLDGLANEKSLNNFTNRQNNADKHWESILFIVILYYKSFTSPVIASFFTHCTIFTIWFGVVFSDLVRETTRETQTLFTLYI